MSSAIRSSIWEYALKTFKDCQDAALTGSSYKASSQPVHQSKWSRPDACWSKLNMDVGLMRDRGSGLGIVCRDSNGSVTACAVVQMSEGWEPRMDEAMVVREGLKYAVRWGVTKVVVESDCLQVIHALRSRASESTEFHLLVDDILSMCVKFADVVWSFVKRTSNKVAHVLAHLQSLEIGHCSWVDEFLENVVCLASLDLINY